MNRDNDIRLAKAVQSLRGAGGAAWDEFMAALVARADHITDQLVIYTGADLQRIQGAAQEARALLNALVEAPKVAEQLYEQERNRAHGNPQR